MTAESEGTRALVEWIGKSMKAELYVELASMVMWLSMYDDGVEVDDVKEEERLISSETLER